MIGETHEAHVIQIESRREPRYGRIEAEVAAAVFSELHQATMRVKI